MSVRDTIDRSPISAFQVRVIAICIVLNMIDGFDILVMSFAASGVAREWSLTGSQIGVLLSSGLVGMAIGSAFLAPLADPMGRRRLTLSGLAVSTLGMTASAMAPSFVALGIGRLITGLGVGALVATLPVLVAEYSPRRRQGTTIALYTVGLPLGGVLGGSVAALVTAQYGWRGLFVIGAVLTFVMFLVSLPAMPESLDYLLARRPPGALTTVNKLLVQMRMARVDALPAAEPAAVGAGTRPGILRGARGARTVLLWFAFFVMMAGFYFAVGWTPRLLEESGFSASQGLSGGVLLNVGGVAAALLFSVLALKVASRVLTVAALVGSALAFLAMSIVLESATATLLVAVAVGVFINASASGLFAIAPGLYPAPVRTTAVGWAAAAGRIGAIVAPVLAGVLLDASWTPPELFALFAVPLVLAASAVAAISFVGWRSESVVSDDRSSRRPRTGESTSSPNAPTSSTSEVHAQDDHVRPRGAGPSSGR